MEWWQTLLISVLGPSGVFATWKGLVALWKLREQTRAKVELAKAQALAEGAKAEAEVHRVEAENTGKIRLAEIEADKKTLDILDAHIARLQAQVDRLQREVDACEQRHEQLKKDYSKLEREHTKLSEDVNKLKSLMRTK